MSKNLKVHGLIEFEELIKKLVIDEGISCTSVANVLNETPSTINNFKKGILGDLPKRGFTTKTLKKMEDTTGLKTFVIIFDGENKKLFNTLKKLHEESLKKLEHMIKEEDKKRRSKRGRRAKNEDELFKEFLEAAKNNENESENVHKEIEIIDDNSGKTTLKDNKKSQNNITSENKHRRGRPRKSINKDIEEIEIEI